MIPDGLNVKIIRLCRYGNVGDVITISYSTAMQLIIRGFAEEFKMTTSAAVIAPTPIAAPVIDAMIFDRNRVKITCICPTFNRRKYLPTSIASFLSQTYTNSELLIVDDSIESVEDLVPKHPRIRYVRCARMKIWEKRNFCCERARGEFIAHWDDDDWQAPGRLQDQLSQLEKSTKSVMVYYNILYWDETTKTMCRCIPNAYACHGATLFYKKSWWSDHKFTGAAEGEDTYFGAVATKADQILFSQAREFMVVRAHPKDGDALYDRGNTSVTMDIVGSGKLPLARTALVPRSFRAPLLDAVPEMKNNLVDGTDPIIIITSCAAYRDNGFNDAARETWLRTWGNSIPYKFILGHGCENPVKDEIILDVDDSYDGLPYKTRAARRWASESGYSHTFHCCTDTYVVVPRLLSSGFEKHAYFGAIMRDDHRLCTDRNVEFAQGGGGYWLNREAGSVVASSEIPSWVKFADDVFVGDSLFKANIPFTHDSRYWGWGHLNGAWDARSVLSVHLSDWRATPKYKIEWMHEAHSLIQKAGV
jgi:glycosyltransferase involved in cell wall biosynthesis